MFPATAFVASPLVATVTAPLRLEVVTNHAVKPKARPIHGAVIAAMVLIRGQRRTIPTGMEAPPTMTPRTVSSQVRFTLTALRMQQKTARTTA